jgi:cob(I)alamin adenosyltransferase
VDPVSGIGRGYIHVYTGEGKGKTTAALGLALRAAGNGLKVLVIQFLKGPEWTGERIAAEKLAANLQIRPAGRGGVLAPSDITAEDRALAREALDEAGRQTVSRDWDVVVLDEINTACSLGLVDVRDVLGIMEAKPAGVEMVLTGRGAPEEVTERADLVTEMKEVKHYFKRGVTARAGIEK